MQNITKNLRTILQDRKMTQKQLADLSGITESAISRYIKGERVPRGVNLIRIAEALSLSVDELVYNDESEKKDAFDQIKEMIARNGSILTKDEKRELAQIIIQSM